MNNQKREITYFACDNLEKTGLVKTIYTTIVDSEWKINFETMDEYSVASKSNYEKLASMLGTVPEMCARCDQTHTANVEIITLANGGEGVTRPIEKNDCDGMVTNERGMLLCTIEADCVPVYILDPVKKAIGMVHSGWKGTAAKISAEAVRLMKETYGSRPEDILVCTGPCICADCYEVSDDLIPFFQNNFDQEEVDSFFKPLPAGKYLLDLKKAIKTTLVSSGVRPENIETAGVCTFHNENFCSYRRDHEPTLRMLTAIMIV